jgi:hypothetical protein
MTFACCFIGDRQLNAGAPRAATRQAGCAAVSASDAQHLLCEALRPRWSIRGTGLSMDRATDGPLVLTENTTDPTARISADDFDFGPHAGFDVSLRRQAWQGHAIEIRYFELGQLDALTQLPTASSLWSINSTPPVFVPGVQSVVSRYRSQLFGFEANYHHSICDQISLLGGFRYLSLDEDLSMNFDAAPQAIRNDSLARNDLYGGQIGLLGIKPIGCLVATADAKAGLFGNHARHRGLLDTGAALLSVDEVSDRTSFAGQLGVGATVRFYPSLQLSVGYTALWLESVAIAADQIRASDYVSGVGIDDRGSALFHGVTYSVELQW